MFQTHLASNGFAFDSNKTKANFLAATSRLDLETNDSSFFVSRFLPRAFSTRVVLVKSTYAVHPSRHPLQNIVRDIIDRRERLI